MQAIAILAHKNIEQVIQLCQLLHKTFSIYIHIDVKCPVTAIQKKQLDELGVNSYTQYDVRWGGYTISQATQFLYREIMKNSAVKYVHLISGEDWIVKYPREIYAFYDNNEKIYLQSEPAKNVVKAGEHIINWIKFYFYYDQKWISRRTIFGKLYHRCIYWMQWLMKINKLTRLKFKQEIYQGAVWSSLPRYAVEYLLNTIDTQEIYHKIFQTSFCSDEFWMQTILENSPYVSKLERYHHHYINWNKKYGTYPGILDVEDLNAIRTGEYHFMRKINLEISHQLLEQLAILPKDNE